MAKGQRYSIASRLPCLCEGPPRGPNVSSLSHVLATSEQATAPSVASTSSLEMTVACSQHYPILTFETSGGFGFFPTFPYYA